MWLSLSRLDALGSRGASEDPTRVEFAVGVGLGGCQVWIGKEDEAQEGLESLVEWTMAVPPFWVPAEVEVGTKLCQMGMNEGQRGWDGCGLVYLKYFLCRSSADLAEWQVAPAEENSSRYQNRATRGRWGDKVFKF